MASPKNINDVTPENYASNNFPEWGTYLNEEIADYKVPAGSFRLWWTGCMGFWLKTHEGTNILWVQKIQQSAKSHWKLCKRRLT